MAFNHADARVALQADLQHVEATLQRCSSASEIREVLDRDIDLIRTQSEGKGRMHAWVSDNKPGQYAWLAEAMEVITSNCGHLAACEGQDGPVAPLFTLMGGCPSSGFFSVGMQAVMFFHAPGNMAFWWVKPSTYDSDRLEWETMNRHDSGTHKNTAGRMASGYMDEVVSMFSAGKSGSVLLGVAEVGSAPRAYLQYKGETMFVYVIWQEDASKGFFSSYIKGRIAYQKDPKRKEFYLRSYAITDGVLSLADGEDGPFMHALPSDCIKDM